MRLQLTIQQTQQYDINGNAIYFQGNNVNSLSPMIGTLPFARQWRNYGSPIDATGEVSDLYALKLEWTAQADNEGFIAPGTFNTKKGASGQIVFEGEAYRLLKQWLVNDISSQLNSVDVSISHYDNSNKLCGTYTNWVIKATDLEWCEDGLCKFNTSFKQKDELFNCIRSTIVTDNWQGWFQDEPTNGKKHPRFSYCNEIRPNGMLSISWILMGMIVFLIKSIVIPLIIALIPILYIIVGVMYIIRTILSIVGSSTTNIDDAIDRLEQRIDNLKNVNQMSDNVGNFYVEAAGCGREHPAPLYRDYITNVCDKCGVKVDAVSAPILFAQNITIETASRGVVTVFNPHYNVCDLHTPSRKGVRRFKNLSLFGVSEPERSTYFLHDNRRYQPLDQFLDEIKGLYNAEWNLKNGWLYFQRKDFFRLAINPYILDLSEKGADRNRLLEGVCFTWNERKIPAFTRGLYSQDGVDTCGDEAMAFMNDTLSFGDASKNPVYDGGQDKRMQFGATKFRGDGVATDYIMDAFQTVVHSSWLTGTFGGNTLFQDVQPILELYADYALLMKDDKNALPKAIIWDGHSYENARVIKTYTGIDSFGSEPRINHKYNAQVYNGKVTGWSTAHVPDTYVRGRNLAGGSQTIGQYQVRDVFGLKYYELTAYLVNYPMYFAIGYEDSMWDWFHWIDDPNRRSVLNRTATAKLELCCDLLNRLRLFGDGSNVALGERIIAPGRADAVITHIGVSYDTSESKGQYIEITADS